LQQPSAGKPISKHFRRCLLLFVYLIVADIVIGGGGRLLTFGPLTIRMILFFVSLILLMSLVVYESDVQTISFKVLAFVIFFLLFYSSVGIINGSTLLNIVMDGNFIVTLLYIPIFYYLISYAPTNIIKMFNYFIFLIVILSLATVIAVILQLLGLLDLRELDFVLKDHGYGGNTGVMPGGILRIYTVSHVFLQFGLSIVLSRIMFKGAFRMDFIYALIIATALLFTFTRGLWMGAFVSAIVIVVKAGFTRLSKSIIPVLSILFIPIVTFGMLGIYSFEQMSSRAFVTLEADKINRGDLVRIAQVGFAMRQFSSSPLFGKGLGAKMNDDYLHVRSLISKKDKEDTGSLGVTIELTYLDLLRKFGIAGFGLVLVTAVIIPYKFARRLRLVKEYDSRLHATLFGFLAGFIGFMITVSTNPYLLNASGMFVYVLLISSLISIRKIFHLGHLARRNKTVLNKELIYQESKNTA